MVHVDMTQPDRALNPGIDLWEVMKAEHEKPPGKDARITLKLMRVSDSSEHIYDQVMLAGRGWGLGKQKLAAFIAADHNGDLDLLMLQGRRIWVATEVQTYNGKDGLRVSIKAVKDGGLKHAGYQKLEDVPAGCVAPVVAAPDAGDTPF